MKGKTTKARKRQLPRHSSSVSRSVIPKSQPTTPLLNENTLEIARLLLQFAMESLAVQHAQDEPDSKLETRTVATNNPVIESATSSMTGG
jgi:hypothetical protein